MEKQAIHLEKLESAVMNLKEELVESKIITQDKNNQVIQLNTKGKEDLVLISSK